MSSKVAVPHPRFPVGASVRITGSTRHIRTARRHLLELVGTVVVSKTREVLVAFPGEKYRHWFSPNLLSPVKN